MDYITIERSVLESIIRRVDSLAHVIRKIKKKERNNFVPILDNQDVCHILNISKRTLQYYRSSGIIPFTRIEKKIYYKPSDVELLLKRNYHEER